MTAISPFAPPRRNSFLRRSSSSSIIPSSSSTSNNHHGHRRTFLFGLFLLVIRFWKHVIRNYNNQNRQSIIYQYLGQPSPVGLLLGWIQKQAGWSSNYDGDDDNDDDDDEEKKKQLRLEKDDDYENKIPSTMGLVSPDASSSSCDENGNADVYNKRSLLSTKPPSSSSISCSTLGRIQENQKFIRQVLNYWFGQYSPDTSQKMLWMIAASSVEHRKRIDLEITERFEKVLQDLAAVGTMNASTCTLWEEWCLDPHEIYGYHGKIAAIIVLDQFSRHMHRHNETITTASTTNTTQATVSSLPTKEQLDKLALKTAQLLVEKHEKEITCGMIPIPMYIFSLMPYRHANIIQSVEYVQQCVEDCANQNVQMEAMIGRFRKATNRRMAVLQDQARRLGNITTIGTSTTTSTTATLKTQTTTNDNNSNNNSDDDDKRNGAFLLDNSSATVEYKDEDILETFAFEADMNPAVDHAVLKTIVKFLEQCGIHPAAREFNKPKPPISPVIVSLSGGVDSMVIASVLCHLKNACGYNLVVIAVHIDYANRPESGAEADFVRRYCESLGILFKCRRIKEVTRGITARDDYERIAREMRYQSYREAIAEAKAKVGKEIANDTVIGVMLGHHRGDLRENVLSNAHKGCGPLDLSGMTAVSKNDGVVIYRPLLPLEKSFVFDYAHKFGVAYFKDTTPNWSTRGKLRNKLLPLLEEIYGEGSMNNLSNLATESDECRELLYKSSIGPFLDQIIRKPMGIIFNTTPWKDQGSFFWKFVLREALHSACLGMFTDKSALAFLERVTAEKVRSGWLQCRRDYAVYLQEDGKVFVFYPSSFPWHKRDMYNVTGEVVGFDEERKVGSWIIKSEIVSEKADCPDTFRLAQKAIPSMEFLMDGKIEYFVQAPTWQIGGKFLPRPLVFSQFTKASRPLAWKNNDLKVQSTLPLLGNDETATKAMKDMSGTGLVHEVDGQMVTNPSRLIKVTLRLGNLNLNGHSS